MKDIKYPPVAIIKGIDVPFIQIKGSFSVAFYDLFNSKTVIFELGHSWIKWATYIYVYIYIHIYIYINAMGIIKFDNLSSKYNDSIP